MVEIFIVVLFGLAFGSFLNVLIYRIPLEKSVIFPSSFCPKCEYKLKSIDNIPLISFLLLRGRCKSCNEKIGYRYPLVEFLGALIFVVVYLKVGYIGFEFWILSFVFSLLLALSIIDIDYKAIPDSLNLLALFLSLFSSLDFSSLNDALLLAGAFTLLRFFVSYFARREALGEGDIPIAATMGAVLGLELALFGVFLAALLALPFALLEKDEERQIPFVPYLVLSMFIVYMLDGYFLAFLENLYA